MKPIHGGLCLLLCAAFPSTVWATDRYFTFTIENDLFVDRDYGYTAGLQLAWAEGPEPTFRKVAPRWLAAIGNHLWLGQNPHQLRMASYKLGGAMFTPKDIDTPTPPANDMPYSGLAFFETSLHAFDHRVADRAYLLLGLVGPDSGAERVQDVLHQALGSSAPQGWDTQLENEVVFKLGLGRKWRLRDWELNGPGWGFDLIGFSELGAGTLDSTADIGMTLRWGRNLLHSFPTAGILPGRDVNPLAGQKSVDFNIFLTVMGRYMPNAIYIEGNNFGGRKSGISLEQEQVYISGGVLWNIGRWGFLYSLAKSSPWFEEINQGQTFGSLSFTYRY